MNPGGCIHQPKYVVFWITKLSEMLFYNKRNICSQTLEMQDDQGVRQQFNAQSSFLDADNVYGYSEQRAKQVVFTQFHIC